MAARNETSKDLWLNLSKYTRRRVTLLTIGANFIGALTVTCYFMFFDTALKYQQIKDTFVVMGIMFLGLVILASAVLSTWERDLSRYTRRMAEGQPVDARLRQRAQRKILDFPLISAMMSLFNWFLAAIIMSLNTIFRLSIETTAWPLFIEGVRTFTGVILSGIVVCAIVYFSIEAAFRKVWPYFFPDGGMVKSPCAFRLKLPTRMLILFFLASMLPIILMAVLSFNGAEMMREMDPQIVIKNLISMTAYLLAATLSVAVILSRLFSTAVIRPVSRMEQAMAKIAKGDLTVSVPVENNDELGALSDHFNQMTEGLKERYELRRSLDLAREVQQSLLPRENPAVEGLDVAGKSIYCDETGGDYFDFLKSGEIGDGKFGVVIGDVSEHGIPSALLMASARAFIRQRSALTGSIARVVSDVNQQLTRDVEESGRFMTLFYLLVDLDRRQLQWVRAGHDPAILYDPATDRFEELGGEGMALGINEDWRYQDYEKSDLSEGQIILLSTDGLWEAQNPEGDMFGKEAIYEIIRRNAALSAQQLLNAMVEKLSLFQKTAQTTDDITIVILKLNRFA